MAPSASRTMTTSMAPVPCGVTDAMAAAAATVPDCGLGRGDKGWEGRAVPLPFFSRQLSAIPPSHAPSTRWPLWRAGSGCVPGRRREVPRGPTHQSRAASLSVWLAPRARGRARQATGLRRRRARRVSAGAKKARPAASCPFSHRFNDGSEGSGRAFFGSRKQSRLRFFCESGPTLHAPPPLLSRRRVMVGLTLRRPHNRALAGRAARPAGQPGRFAEWRAFFVFDAPFLPPQETTPPSDGSPSPVTRLKASLDAAGERKRKRWV